jgi:hypothetical protein
MTGTGLLRYTYSVGNVGWEFSAEVYAICIVPLLSLNLKCYHGLMRKGKTVDIPIA